MAPLLEICRVGVRLHLVTGMTNLTGKSTGQFSFAHHYAANEMAFAITKVQASGTSGIQVHVSNPVNDGFTGTGSNSALFLNETNVLVSSIMILDSTGHDVTSARSVSFDAAHEVATITGLSVGDQVFVTGASSFERLEVDYSSGNPFDIGNAQVVSTVTGSDVALHVNTTLTDHDGDAKTSSSGLDVTLYSPDHNIIDHHTMTTSDAITGTAKNDVIIVGTGATTIDLGSTTSGGHDTVVVSNKLDGHDVVSNFVDHTAANASTQADHIDIHALLDKLGGDDAHRVVNNGTNNGAINLAQSGTDVVMTVAGAPSFQLTIHNETVSHLSVGADNTHDIITGHLQ